METIINRLLQRFENGSLSRRQLIQGLAMLATAGSAPLQAQTRGFQGGFISHVSLSVSDLQRSTEFYQKVFGLVVLSQDKPNEIVRLGLTPTQRARIHFLSTVHEDVSATVLRRRLSLGDPCPGLVPPDVATYIQAHGLYR